MPVLSRSRIRIGTFSSVATHWLPNIIKEFQKDYPYIDYELLLGDYTEIEEWILEGRVDCGFMRLPAHPELETIFLEQDQLMAIMSMVESGLALRNKKTASLAVKRFMVYLQYR